MEQDKRTFIITRGVPGPKGTTNDFTDEDKIKLQSIQENAVALSTPSISTLDTVILTSANTNSFIRNTNTGETLITFSGVFIGNEEYFVSNIALYDITVMDGSVYNLDTAPVIIKSGESFLIKLVSATTYQVVRFPKSDNLSSDTNLLAWIAF